MKANDALPEALLGGRRVGPSHPPFVVAEMSGNHNGSLERALQIVDAAAAAGAHALKIQTYTADTMTLDIAKGEFSITAEASLWRGQSLYRLYQEAHTPWDWHRPIFDRCRERGILGFSSPFDASAVDLLEGLGAPFYKIASFENVDIPLIRRVALTGKPVIISTGMATLAELSEAVAAARGAGCRDLILLKCTSSYPADSAESHLRTIPHMQDLFGCPVGLSDHTLGVGASLAAVGLGACFLERHFTLARADGGVDAAFSLEPAELQMLVKESEVAWRAQGSVRYGPSEHERPSLQFRRSLYVARDMRAGEAFTTESLRAIRPGLGLPPRYLEILLGKRVNKDVARGTPVSWDLIG